MSFYLIEFDKHNNGWIVKKQQSNYKYVKISNSPIHSCIKTAEKWVNENHVSKHTYDTPWIDHKIKNHTGHLMSLESWKKSCEEGAFIDYDGYGDLISNDYDIIGQTTTPSDHTHRKKDYPVNATHILWYNR